MAPRENRSVARVLKRLAHAMTAPPARTDAGALDRLERAMEALDADLRDLQTTVRELSARAVESRRRAQDRLDACRSQVRERARLAALPRARLLSDRMALQGAAADRLDVERLAVGEPFERQLDRWMGVTRCSTTAADVRSLWERLLEREAECGHTLRGRPSAVLAASRAVASKSAAEGLEIALGGDRDAAAARHAVCAVPRFAYDFPARKLRNFGHWLLDCVPQAVALAALAPDAMFLLPEPVLRFQALTLSLGGVAQQQLVPWDGSPIAAGRLLVLESDGRLGGGRPLSALMEMRRLVAPPGPARSAGRRIYVSRRDARRKRRWLSNEPDVEQVFRSRGFEVLVMAECPLEEQIRIFREAAVVAGVSGAGLADLVFAPSGTHAIVLLSDSLMRWYADDVGQRSAWARRERGSRGALASLGDSPRFYAHLAAAFEQRCHSFVAADRMPLNELSAFVDDVLHEVGRA